MEAQGQLAEGLAAGEDADVATERDLQLRASRGCRSGCWSFWMLFRR